MRNKSKKMFRSLTPLLTLLFTAREATDPENNQYTGIAERLVTFMFLNKSADKSHRASTAEQCAEEDEYEYDLEPHITERSRS